MFGTVILAHHTMAMDGEIILLVATLLLASLVETPPPSQAQGTRHKVPGGQKHVDDDSRHPVTKKTQAPKIPMVPCLVICVGAETRTRGLTRRLFNSIPSHQRHVRQRIRIRDNQQHPTPVG
jgi:hypothetical protein